MRRLALIIGIAVISGCVTPSIPIPPPDPAMMLFQITIVGAASTASLTYPPVDTYEGGIAYVYNRTQGVGVIQNVMADGGIGPTPPTPAALGDQMIVSVENNQQTQSTCIILQEGLQNPTNYCP